MLLDAQLATARKKLMVIPYIQVSLQNSLIIDEEQNQHGFKGTLGEKKGEVIDAQGELITAKEAIAEAIAELLVAKDSLVEKRGDLMVEKELVVNQELTNISYLE